MKKEIVYIYNSRKYNGIKNTVKLILNKLEWQKIIQEDKPIYIKLNLSSANPKTLHYANTDKDVLEALLEVLTTKTKNIFLIESDLARGDKESGLYGGGRAEDMFRLNGIDKIAKDFGIKTLNLSLEEQVFGLNPLFEDFGLPKCLLDNNKIFISLPVIKTHALTGFTGALKNQWGCVPRWDRILLHKNLDELIVLCNKFIKPDLIIMGGKYAMEGRGPTSGEPRKFPIILGSTKPASIDAVAASLIGLDPFKIKHIKLACSEVLGEIDIRKIQIIGEFKENKTQFKKAKLDWVLRLVNYLSRYEFFVYKILMNQKLFNIAKKIVKFLRKIKIVR